MSKPRDNDARRQTPIPWIAVSIIVLHTALVAFISRVNGPNLDESAHLVSGVSHWTFGRFELYRVNPPLVRLVAALPLLMTDARYDWSLWEIESPYARSEFLTGLQFQVENGLWAYPYLTFARWACLPLCLVGLWSVFLWARQLYGNAAGLMALSLYCFSPDVLAWGASITPDAAAASMGVFAAYMYWRWFRKPEWSSALLAGVALGLAELVKSTWIILFVLWPLQWVVFRITSANRRQDAANGALRREEVGTTPPLWQLVSILLTGLYLVNLGYGGTGSFQRLGDFRFISRSLSGADKPSEGANRFAETVLSSLPVPVPENYLRGIDVQKFDFEQGKWSYLCGEQRKGGWWYYYLFALLVKTPLGGLALFAGASIAFFYRSCRSSAWDEFAILCPAIAILVLVSSQTGFSRHLRYVLPAIPFLCIHTSRIAISFARRRWMISSASLLLLTSSIVESLSIFPHSMSFFNMAAGGPLNGHALLLDANIDWGQDLLFLKRWYDSHPEARPLHLAFFCERLLSPKAAGIDSIPAPGYLPKDLASEHAEELTGPCPGWFAISVNHWKGYRHYENDVPQYTYFQKLKPVARAGYSVYLYHLTLDQANELRRELGLGPYTPE